MYRQAAVVGVGHTEYSSNSGRSEWRLALEAVTAALADAGLEAGDVDGVVRFSYDSVRESLLARSLGFTLRYFGEVGYGGQASGAVVAHAASAIASGQASAVVCFRSLNERSGVRYGRAERSVPTDEGEVRVGGQRTPSGAFAAPYGLLAPGQVMAMWARRYQAEYKLSDAQLAEALGTVAVQQRSYANTNPVAAMHDRPLDMDTYLSSRMIAEPLRLFDYCLETDGAAAVVVTSADIAQRLRPDPVYVLSASQVLYPHSDAVRLYGELANGPTCRASALKLFSDARITPADVDVALLYDATTIKVLLQLEGYGFDDVGQGWRRVLEDGIGPDSQLPVNTHGGLLSEGYIHGINHIIEGVRQLRGTAANQVPDAEFALYGCEGASSVLLGR